ncbi:MAG: alpha amylase N-terminal ig-like domain-containing protein, partial [Anaerolineales bacterium]|nr:alpha amylase N-terminal ig-like domain-containing protein [Anaerolineales bacterium]
MTIDPVRYYGANGSLFPYDLRHLAADPAFCDPRPDGSVWLRLHTEPGFAEANLIYRDGEFKAAPMQLWGETARFQFWQLQLQPESAAIQYAFALRRQDGTIVYFGPSGVTFGLEF